MWNEDVETLVLSGKLFGRDYSSSSSPERSPSPDSGWHDEELKHSSHSISGGSEDEDISSASRWREPAARRQEATANESIGMGPGRTGVKGVIRDRNEALSRERERQRYVAEELNRKLEATNLGGKTYLEEEREKALDPHYEGKIDDLVFKERERLRELQDEKRGIFGRRRERRFGHLREVGIEGFVASVEEDKDINVVVHIYDPSLDRCEDLDDTLMELARQHLNVKFLRARASVLGFASSSRTSTKKGVAYGHYLNHSVDISDAYGDQDDDDESDNRGSEQETAVDLDMLPTLLVYRAGELVHNWVRVDWEAGPSGVEDLLQRHHIIPHKRLHSENLGFPPDGPDDEFDDDLQWSDSDEI